MENASKALLMAGGILIIVILLSLVVISYNNISAHQQQKTDSETSEELIKFNSEFTNYISNSIHGYELVSLINKVVDYNGEGLNGENYLKNNPNGFKYETISVVVSGFDQFQSDYGNGGSIKVFSKDSYEIKNNKNNNDDGFYKTLDKFDKLENDLGLKRLKLIYANKSGIADGTKNINSFMRS